MLVHSSRPPAVGANPAGSKPPLLILLHGVGSNEQSMAAIAPAFDPRFVVVSVRSPLVLGPNSFAWFHVNFTSGGPVIIAAEAQAGWEMIARFIDEAVTAYGADPGRVFLAGFSQGGIMSLATVLTSPSRIAGVASMSGRLLPEVLPHVAPPSALRDKPVLIVHGTEDEVLGIQFARSARQKLEGLGVSLTYEEFAMGHQITRESVTVVSSWLTARLDEASTV